MRLQAGKLLRTEGFKFDLAYTSVLKRAIKTLQNVLEQLDQLWVPVEKSWRLNERHYGDLQGRNKAETAKKFGDKQVHIWRRSYDIPPAGTPLTTSAPVSLLSLNWYQSELYPSVPANVMPSCYGQVKERLKTQLHNLLSNAGLHDAPSISASLY